MNKKGINIITHLGIGVFGYISISELSGLIEYLTVDFLTISGIKTRIALWLPKLLNLSFFILVVTFGINKYLKHQKFRSERTLKFLISLFVGIFIVQFLYTFYCFDFFREKYPVEFENYMKMNNENLELLGYLEFIHILNYIFLGIIFLNKRKTFANKELRQKTNKK